MVDLDQLEGVRESKSPSPSPNFSLSLGLGQLQTVFLCLQSSASSTTQFQSPKRWGKVEELEISCVTRLSWLIAG